MKAEIAEIKEIPLDLLEIGQSQVRTRNVDRGIEDLAKSIDHMGLLEPIIVAPLEGGRFEILTGQRRFLAHEMLKRPTIRACVLKHRVSPEIATAISLTENMVRQDISTKEYINACTELYRKYGSIKAVSDELGLPYGRVSEYVKFDQLVKPLKDMVQAGAIELKTALRAQKAATDDTGTVHPDNALVFAQEMKGMTGLQQKNLETAAEAQPDAPAEKIIEQGRKQPKQKQIVVTVGDDMHAALQKYAQDEGTNQDDAAALLLESALSDKGYLGSSGT